MTSKLQNIRKAKGLTQKELADATGINLRTLQHYEQGNKDLNKAAVDAVYKIAVALGVAIEDLIDLDKAALSAELEKPKADDGLGTSEPIIDCATYTRVQEKLKEQRETKLAPPPLGYKMEGGKLVVDEDGAEVVKRATDEMARDGNLSLDTEKDLLRLWKQRYSE